MAQGELVMLSHRVYLNGDRTAVAEEGSPDAAWFLGGPGHTIQKDQADALGLTADGDYQAVPNAMTAIIEQERRNRAQHAESSAVVIQPAPVFTQTQPDRMAFDRESGDPISGHPDVLAAQRQASMEQMQAANADPEAATTEEDVKADTSKASATSTSDTPPAEEPKQAAGGATRAQSAPANTRARTPEENK